jgi:hypothetical protein
MELSQGGVFEGRVRVRTLTIAAILVALAAPTFAQDTAGSNKHHRAPKTTTAAPPKMQANDKDYKAALDRLPQQKFDPWGTARSAPSGDKR